MSQTQIALPDSDQVTPTSVAKAFVSPCEVNRVFVIKAARAHATDNRVPEFVWHPCVDDLLTIGRKLMDDLGNPTDTVLARMAARPEDVGHIWEVMDRAVNGSSHLLNAAAKRLGLMLDGLRLGFPNTYVAWSEEFIVPFLLQAQGGIICALARTLRPYVSSKDAERTGVPAWMWLNQSPALCFYDFYERLFEYREPARALGCLKLRHRAGQSREYFQVYSPLSEAEGAYEEAQRTGKVVGPWFRQRFVPQHELDLAFFGDLASVVPYNYSVLVKCAYDEKEMEILTANPKFPK